MAILHPALLPAHTKSSFVSLRLATPNRICFATVHANALKDNSGTFAARHPFKFGIPFRHGVVREIYLATGIQVPDGKYGPWMPLSEKQAERIRAFIAEQGTRVYLKDFFDCSLALGERTVGGKDTAVGRLFSDAKYRGDKRSIEALVGLIVDTVGSMRSFKDLDCISCPPPRPGKSFDLPTFIAEETAKRLKLRFAALGTWSGEKGQLKAVAAHQKWDELEKIGFEVSSEILKVKRSILLLDDIYQSGTTLNFLRSCLTRRGVAGVSAISLVKAARDTDNQ